MTKESDLSPVTDQIRQLEYRAWAVSCSTRGNFPKFGYLVRVHDRFMLQLYDRVQRITYELGASGVTDFTLGELLRKNCNAFSYETIQEIAEALLAIKHK